MCESMVIETLHLAVEGDVVLTERVDTITVGERVATLPVMGTFEIRDGRISAWRDYFDMTQITNMLSGGLTDRNSRAGPAGIHPRRDDSMMIG